MSESYSSWFVNTCGAFAICAFGRMECCSESTVTLLKDILDGMTDCYLLTIYLDV